MDLISIVIPAHNVEKYINRCIESILKQTYSNVEIIIIEDSSQDKTPQICDTIAKNNYKVTVFHETNCSAGKSRNSGVMKANGRFLVFVDADDYLEETMIQKLYYQIINKMDAVFCGYSEFDEKNKNIRLNNPNLTNEIFEKEEVFNEIIFNTIYAENEKLPLYAVWAGMYRTDLIKEKNIEFLNESEYYSEDSIFNFEYLSYSNRIGIINEPLYNHDMGNVNSICNKYNKRLHFLNRWRDKIFQLANKNNIDKEKTEYYVSEMYVECTLFRIVQEVYKKESKLIDNIRNARKILNEQTLQYCLNNVNISNKSKNRKILIFLMKKKYFYIIIALLLLKKKK